ncbi:iron complex transport system substrate-binding protein [Rhodococcus tukisamuensis]|uniref:Iron complex transport system substrate-binding protein n=2 Tax=Rhodococcus tukisamuensis TaxID=168276 RepID=A0A1G6VRE1_9NOCA|nr:ABC transporter substrate-binding protein [Rhodococcus tukisamuensis]SDD55557.1 iron complex transport system substrate-binding protein [Rhodococcus tukisamuensis]
MVAAALIAVVATFASAACGGSTGTGGSDASGGASAGDGTFPVTVRSGASGSGDEVTIAARPEAVVSLSPTATETLWALGAGEQVVAVDALSDYPAGVPTTDLSGFSPNVEAVLGYQPDLVIAMDDTGGLVSGLKAAGVPTLLLPAAADLDDAYSQIERIGAATGHLPDAAALVASMRGEIDAAVAAAPPRAEQSTYFHELDDTLFTISGQTFLGEIYGLFGLRSIADAAGAGDAYPQLSAEYVVSADPDLIFLADGQCCGVTAEKVAARPGWSGMAAVRDGRVHVLDEDVSSRWGPRVVDLVTAIGGVLAAQPAPVG